MQLSHIRTAVACLMVISMPLAGTELPPSVEEVRQDLSELRRAAQQLEAKVSALSLSEAGRRHCEQEAAGGQDLAEQLALAEHRAGKLARLRAEAERRVSYYAKLAAAAANAEQASALRESALRRKALALCSGQAAASTPLTEFCREVQREAEGGQVPVQIPTPEASMLQAGESPILNVPVPDPQTPLSVESVSKPDGTSH